jgi:hypothetical protein
VFVRNIDLALQRAEASYSRDIWNAMTPRERCAAIYHELRALDAQSAKSAKYTPLERPRRSGGQRRILP